MARRCDAINNMKLKRHTITIRPLKTGKWSVRCPWFPTRHIATAEEAIDFAVGKASAKPTGTVRLIIYDTNGGSACRTF